MANTLRFKRGLAAGITPGVAGEPLFTTDTFDLYIGNGTTNTRFQKYIASGTTSQLLRGDGSLLTMPIVLTSPANGEVLKYNGTTWVNSSDAGITGSGLAGQVAYFTGATTQGGNNNLFWDIANGRLGIGTNVPSRALVVIGDAIFQSTSTGDGTTAIRVNNSAGTQVLAIGAAGGIIMNNSTKISTNTSPTSTQPQLEIFNAGTGNTTLQSSTSFGLLLNPSGANVVIGSTTNGTQRLQVTGDTLMKGSGNTSATTALTVQNSDGNAIFRVVNDGRLTLTSSNFVGIIPTNAGSNSPEIGGVSLRFLTNTATAAQSNFYFRGVNALSGTSGNQININANETFQPTSGTATFTQIQLGGSINQTGGANGITRGLYVNPTLTAAADWRSIEWNNNTGWGLYGAGTSDNYLGGNTAIGNTTIISRTNLTVWKNITGDVTSFGIYSRGAIQSGVTSEVNMFVSVSETVAASFTLNQLKHFRAFNFGFGAGSVVTNQYGFIAESNIIGATNNYGFYGDIASGTNRWNLFMNGTAANFLLGDTQIGTGALTSEKLQVNGTMKVTGATTFDSSDIKAQGYRILKNGSDAITFSFYQQSISGTVYGNSMQMGASGDIQFWNYNAAWNKQLSIGITGAATFSSSVTATSYNATTQNVFSVAGTEGMRLTATNRNLHIGTFSSDSGEKLQVTGTAKITGATAIGGQVTVTNNIILDAASNLNYFLKGAVGGWARGYRFMGSSNTQFGGLWMLGNSDTSSYYTLGSFYNVGLTVLHSNGNVGVNNTNPTTTLDVSGTFNATGAATFSSSVTAGGNLLLTNGTAASIGAINLIRTGTSPVASRMTFGTDDTGYSFAIAKNVTGTVTDLVTIADSGAATFSSSIQAASATITGNLTVDSSTLFVDATANEVGIGTNAPNSVLQVVGSVSKSISDVKTANYTATATDHTILCSAAGGGFTITLPAASGITGRIYVIKKTNASSGVNSVTVDGNGSETIDGSASINLACRSSVMLQCDGSNWHILSLYSDSSCL